MALAGRPMIAHAIERLRPQVAKLAISANGDPSRFAPFGLPVVADDPPEFSGPLAGVLAGLEFCAHSGVRLTHVATLPADTPLAPEDFVARLHAARRAANAEIVVAVSHGRIHHVAALWPAAIAGGLAPRDCRRGRAQGGNFRRAIRRDDGRVAGRTARPVLQRQYARGPRTRRGGPSPRCHAAAARSDGDDASAAHQPSIARERRRQLRVEAAGEGVPGVKVAPRHADDQRHAVGEGLTDLGQHAAALGFEPSEAVDDEEVRSSGPRRVEPAGGRGDRGRIDPAARRVAAEVLHDVQRLAGDEIAHAHVLEGAEAVGTGAFLHEAGDSRAALRRRLDECEQRRIRLFVTVEHDRGEPARGCVGSCRFARLDRHGRRCSCLRSSNTAIGRRTKGADMRAIGLAGMSGAARLCRLGAPLLVSAGAAYGCLWPKNERAARSPAALASASHI